MPPTPFWTSVLSPLNTPLKVIVLAVLAMSNSAVVSVPVNEPLPLNVKLLVPLIVAVSPVPIVKLLAMDAVSVDCNAPPFNASEPVPNALVAAPTSSVPAVNVTAPVNKVALFVPETINAPPGAFSVNAPLPLKSLLNVVMAEFVTVKLLPFVILPVPLNVKLAAPLIVAAPPTVKLLVSVAVSVNCKSPPFKSNAPLPNAFVATAICNVPAVKVVVPENEALLVPETTKVPP